MQKGQSSSPCPVRSLKKVKSKKKKRLSDTSSVTDSGQVGIKTQNLELSLEHSCLPLFTNAYIYKRDLIKTTSSESAATGSRNATRENESLGPCHGRSSSAGAALASSANSSETLAQTAEQHGEKNSRDKEAGSRRCRA